MSFLDWLLNKKKKEPIEFPYHYIQIVWTETALNHGVLDDFNKEIQRIKAGRIIDRVQYTEEEASALAKSFNIPIIDRTKIKDKDDFQFEEIEALTGTFTERR